MSNQQIVEFKKNLSALIDRKELPLPSNVSPEAFRNAALVAVQDNPKILGCDQNSVFKSVRTLAAAGLVPDGREAALVPFKTKDGQKWVEKCQAMPMVFGLIKMVRRSGEVSDIRAHIVYQNEVNGGYFSYIVGDEERLEHQPILFGDRGQPVACYAIAKLKDGGIVREFMSAEEVDTVRRSSAAQKIYAKGQRPKTSDEPIGIWKDWWTEMWKKTVIRRLCKRLDMSSEDMRRVMIEQDTVPMKDVTPAPAAGGFADRANAAAQITQQQPVPDAEEEREAEPVAADMTTQAEVHQDSAESPSGEGFDLPDGFEPDPFHESYEKGRKAFSSEFPVESAEGLTGDARWQYIAGWHFAANEAAKAEG